MRVVVVGGGPVGTFCALALQGRGHDVTLVDRDPGPTSSATWVRRGVMQFNHPHLFRAGCRRSMEQHVPGMLEAIVAAGGILAHPDGLPDELTGIQCRRSTLERAIWDYADWVRLPRVTGHADEILTDGDRVQGVLVDGVRIDADLVVVATGRAGRLADELRAPGESIPCGYSYVSRMYRALPGVDVPETAMPMLSEYDGYIAIAFPQDARTMSALIIRPSDDEMLAGLREVASYERAVRAIPQLAPWTDPDRFEPITDVMVGGALYNSYRGQRDAHGDIACAGLVFVGDAVLTTNPAAGRGVTTGMWQVERLLGLLDGTGDLRHVAETFDDWCVDTMRPWFADHVLWDATLSARMRGEDIDPEGPLPAMLVCDAAAADPSILGDVLPFLGMFAGPASVEPAVERARAALRAGWRPQWADGPTRDELVAAVFEPALS